MEFIRLADVDVVETANDTDKVLIEQNGEIKRVPKTEVGGSGGSGNMLTLNIVVSDPQSLEMSLASSNMSLDEAIMAMSNNELTGAMLIVEIVDIQKTHSTAIMFADYTAEAGSAAILFFVFLGDSIIRIMWTADGIQMME